MITDGGVRRAASPKCLLSEEFWTMCMDPDDPMRSTRDGALGRAKRIARARDGHNGVCGRRQTVQGRFGDASFQLLMRQPILRCANFEATGHFCRQLCMLQVRTQITNGKHWIILWSTMAGTGARLLANRGKRDRVRMPQR